MPAATSTRSSAPWKRNEQDASPVTRRDDRLALAHAAGELPLPASGPVAVLRAQASDLYDRVGRERFRLWQGNRVIHDALAAGGFSVAPGAAEAASGAIVFATRSRADTMGAVAEALGIVPEGAPVVVTGARTDGIDAVMRAVGEAVPIAGRMSKAHGRVFHIARPAALPAAAADWAEAWALKPNDEGWVTGPGMFSPDHPDPGSERLAGHLEGRLKGRVADLGAGWGWLAARALATCKGIEAIDLHEAEARALEAARANVTDARASFHWSDVTRLGGGGHDWVVTNPPFHRSRAAEPDLGAAFIAAAARILKPSGRLLLVANRSLPYEAPLGRAFREVRPLAEDGAYKVVEAARPRPVRGGPRSNLP
jgi:16S rRNA (guanine1207-N2)-methyltransferase